MTNDNYQRVKHFTKKILTRLGWYDYFSYLYESHFQNLKKFSLWEYRENFFFYIKGKAKDGLPVPPMALIWLVIRSIRKIRFIETGHNQVNKLLLPMLAEKNVVMNEIGSLLDFGCGCGRLTRYFQHLDDTIVWGVDYNPKLVSWCKKHLPFANFEVNNLIPPLSFENNKFDLIIARSVFTHLDEKIQNQWFNELHRILKPNGYLFFTVMGDHYFGNLSPSQKQQYESGNIVVVYSEYSGQNRCAVYHPRSYTERLCKKHGFEIVNYKKGGVVIDSPQDSYVCKAQARAGTLN